MKLNFKKPATAVIALLLVAGASGLMVGQAPQPVGTWAPLATVADSRVQAASAVLADGRTVIVGGYVAGAPTATIVVYDPLTNAFAAAGSMRAARVGHTATVLEDGRVLIAGGSIGDQPTADLEIFTPAADPAEATSVLVGTMAVARAGHAAARLADGRVLLAGGTVGAAATASAEVFDPQTGTTAAAQPMTVGRSGLSATRLVDGRVLVAGGNNGVEDLASAEIFTPWSQTFAAAATTLTVPRSGHSAVLLPHNNGVLIAGGMSNGVVQSGADLFLPATFPDPFSYGEGQFVQTGPMAAPRSSGVGGPAGDDGYAYVAGGVAPNADGELVGATGSEVYRFATIKTDKDDYPPGELAVISGSGWRPGEDVTLRFQEDPAVHEDYVLTVTADGNGNIRWDRWAPEEHDLNVRFYLMATDSVSRAQTTFTDSRTITSVTLNGVSSVTVAPSASVTAVVNVTTANGGGNANWRSTGWLISTTAPGTLTCVNHSNHDGAGSYSESFSITAPASAGTYNAYFIAYQADDCTSQPSNTFTLTNGVTVDATAPSVTSINRASGNPTLDDTVTWQVIFSESVTGVDTSDFALAASGLTGTPGITGVSGSGTTYNVTATTGDGTGTLGLNLVDDDSIQDAPTNKLGGTGLGNGNFTGQAFDINRTLTPAITADNKTYDGNDSATILTRTFTHPNGLSVPATVTITGGTATFDNKNVGTGKTVTATGLALSGTGSEKYLLSSSSATTTASITARALTIAAASDTKVYNGNTASTASPTVTGLQPGDTVTGLVQEFDSRNAGGRTLTVTAYTINDGNSGANYVVTLQTAAGTITPAPLTVSATSDTKVYNGTKASSATPAVSGIISPDTVTGLVQEFDSRNAGPRTLSVTAHIVNDGNGGANYSVTVNTAAGTITPAPLTIDATSDARVYNGTKASSATPSVAGLFSPDTVTGLVQEFDSRNAGPRTLSVTGYTVNDGNGGGNYTVTLNTAAGTITPAPLTIAATGDTRIYDGTTASSATPSVSGLFSPDTVTGLVQVFDSRNAGPRTLSVTAFTVNDGNGGANYAVTPQTAAGTITPAPLTIAATGDTRMYNGTTASSATPSVAGLFSPDTVTGLMQVFDSRNAGPRTLSVTAFTVNDGNGGANYAVTPQTAAGTITPAPLTINAIPDTKVYDGTTASTASPAVIGIISPDTVTGLLQEFDSKNAGARTLTVTAYTIDDGNGGANYNVTPNSAAGTITPAPLTISATSDSKAYDGATASSATPSVAGLFSPDTVTGLVQVFDSRNAGPRTLSVTAYAVNDGNGGGNYTVTPQTAAGTITPASLTISATADTKVYDGTTVSSATPTATGIFSPDTVTGLVQVFDSRNAGPRTLSVTAFTVNDGNGGANYTVTPQTAAGAITPAPLTINATPDTKVYDGTAASSVSPTFSGNISPDTVTGLVQEFDSRNGGSRTLSVTAYTVNDGNGGANYNVTPNSATGTITSAPLTITAISDTKVYDGTKASSAVPTVTGIISPDTVTGLVQEFDSRNAGPRTMSVTAHAVNDGNGGANYAVTLQTAAGTITPAPLTISATSDSKAYDGATASSAMPAVTGLFSPDTVTGRVQQFDSRNAGPRTLSVTGYTVNDGNSGANYTVTPQTASGSITPAALTISATSDTKVYDGTTASSAVPTVTGIISPDTVTGLVQEFDSRNAGPRTLSVTAYTVNDGNSGGNYTVTLQTASGSITTAALTIAATNKFKTYGTVTVFDETSPSLDFSVTGLLNGDMVASTTLTSAGAAAAATVVPPGPIYAIVPSAAAGTGLGNYTISYVNGSLTVTTAGTTTTIVSDLPDPSAASQSVTVAYNVTVVAPGAGTPTGAVTVAATTGESCTGTVTAGNCVITFMTVGSRALTASYAGDGNFSSSDSAAEPHHVNPLAVNDAYSTPQATTLNPPAGVLSNDVHAPVTATLVSPPAQAFSFALQANGSFSYTPLAAFSGPDSFTYVACVGANCSAPASVTLTVAAASTGGAVTTYSQGGWGASPAGNNPGTIRAAHFSAVYPAGVTIGKQPGPDHSIKFSSSTAVDSFLPAGGKPAALTNTALLLNPASSSAGVFAGQVLALQMSYDFSNAGKTPFGLAQLCVKSGPLAGKTVQYVLDLANQVLGGNTAALPSGLSLSGLNDVVTSINENFDGGKVNKGFLIACTP